MTTPTLPNPAYLYDIWQHILRQCPPAVLIKAKITNKTLHTLFLQYQQQYASSAEGFMPAVPLIGLVNINDPILQNRILRFDKSITTCQRSLYTGYLSSYGPTGNPVTLSYAHLTHLFAPTSSIEALVHRLHTADQAVFYGRGALSSTQFNVCVHATLWRGRSTFIPTIVFEIGRGVLCPDLDNSAVPHLIFAPPAECVYHIMHDVPPPGGTFEPCELRIQITGSNKITTHVLFGRKEREPMRMYIVDVEQIDGKWQVTSEKHRSICSMPFFMTDRELFWSDKMIVRLGSGGELATPCMVRIAVQNAPISDTKVLCKYDVLPILSGKHGGRDFQRLWFGSRSVQLFVFATKTSAGELGAIDSSVFVIFIFDTRSEYTHAPMIHSIRVISDDCAPTAIWCRARDEMIMFACVDQSELRVYELNLSPELVWRAKVTIQDTAATNTI